MIEVAARDLNKVRMIEGNEKLYRIVIDEGVLKEWVGIGWIELREAKASDAEKYPTVTRNG